MGVDLERLVAPIFIESEHYGTRASSVVRLGQTGTPEMIEQSWTARGTPDGAPRSSLSVS